MPQDPHEQARRRLIGILCADIAGYSRLMGEDEASTLRVLVRYREIAEQMIRHHGGRLANTAGDSLLVEFPNVTDALQCALDIQGRIALANEDIHPERRGLFRMGLHVGEVLVRNGDLFGDAVNVAARMEAIAPAGGVCLSEAVMQFLSHTEGVTFQANGAHQVKNIAKPINTYLATAPLPQRSNIPAVHRRILIHLARRFHGICDEALRDILSEVDLVPVEYATLASLEDTPGLSGMAVATRIGISSEQANQTLEKLCASQLVATDAQSALAEDRQFFLTSYGSAVRQKYKPAVVAAIDRIVAPLSGEERVALHDMLARIIRGAEAEMADYS